MYLPRETYEKIVKNYPTLLVVEDDPAEAFRFVWDVLTAEADAIHEKEPYAHRSVADMEEAAYRVFDIGGDIDAEDFGEE